MKTYKIFFYKYCEESKTFKTDTVYIKAWGKEQAIRKFEDLNSVYSNFTIQELN